MTISIFRFDLERLGTKMATRPNGQAFLDEAIKALENHQVVEIDFNLRSPSPSFADQCIGGLVRTYGLSAFKERIRLINVAADARPLIKHIIMNRSRSAPAAESVH